MKQIILLFLCMLAGICSGCSRETEKTDKNSNNSQSIENNSEPDDVSAENTSNDTMPSGSIGTVNGIEIEICGHKVSFPCEFKELGDEFTLENGYYFEEQDYTLYHLYYQNENTGTIYLAGAQKDDNSNAMVVGIDTRNLKNNQFFIDGLGYDTRETYIEHFGEPDVQKENHLEYVSENIAFAVFFFDSNSEDIDFAENIVLLFTNQGRKKIYQDTTDSAVMLSENTDSTDTEHLESVADEKNISSKKDIYQKIISEIELCGVKLTLPCNSEIFNDDFSMKNGVLLENYNETSFLFYYKDIELGAIIIEDFGNGDDIESEKIVGLYIKNPDSENFNHMFSAGEINFESTKKEAAEIFGIKDYAEKNSLCLDVDAGHDIVCFFGDDEKMVSIEIYAKE